MIIYALDTNIISYILKGNRELRDRIILEIDSGNNFAIPPMVLYELKRWLLKSGATAKLAALEQIITDFDKDGMSISEFELAASEYATLVNSGLNIDDGDIFIACHCIQNDYTLVTNNEKHFSSFNNLKTANWIND